MALGLLIFIGTALLGAAHYAQTQATKKSHKTLSQAIDEQAKVTQTRLEHEYLATMERINEQAAIVGGSIQARSAVSGLAGGEGTIGAVGLESVRTRRAKDEDLLTEQFNDALADLEAQTNLAKKQLDASYAAAMSQLTANFIGNLASIGLTIGQAYLSTPTLTGTILSSGGNALSTSDWGLGSVSMPAAPYAGVY